MYAVCIVQQINLQITSIWIYYKLIHSWVWIFEEQQKALQYTWYHKKQKKMFLIKDFPDLILFIQAFFPLHLFFGQPNFSSTTILAEQTWYNKAIFKVFITIAEIPEAATHRCWVAVLKIFAKFTRKHLCWTPFQMKLQSFSLQMYSKVTPAQVFFFSKILHKLSEQLFYKSLQGWMGDSLRIKDTIYYQISLVTSF